MQQERVPEILRTSIESFVLQVLSMGINLLDFESFQVLDKPDNVTSWNGQSMMIELGVLNLVGDMNEKGIAMSLFNTEPAVTNVILQAYKRECLDEVLRAISIAQSANELFITKPNMPVKQEIDSANRRSDFLRYSDLSKSYEAAGPDK
jgi:HrpA-like RNA helicase